MRISDAMRCLGLAALLGAGCGGEPLTEGPAHVAAPIATPSVATAPVARRNSTGIVPVPPKSRTNGDPGPQQ
jgi:hypothetical protein